MKRLSSFSKFNFFADYQPEHFTLEEKKLLKPFFSNSDKPVFAVSGLPSIVLGALVGRHSQSPDSMRRVFLDEFVKSSEVLAKFQESSIGRQEFLDITRANSFLGKFFGDYGHDSLAATVPLVLGFERVSQLGAKGIEDIRIGLSPIERSTRYGFFGRKQRGQYSYARNPVIMASSYARLYEETINAALDLYVQIQKPVAKAYRKKFPKEDKRAIKRMTFDAIRVLLVAGNFTNLGAMINGQAAEQMIIKLKASELSEHREIGRMLEEEIAKLAPALVQRIRGDFGEKTKAYRVHQRQESRKLAEKYLPDTKAEKTPKGVTLTNYDGDGEARVIAKILWPGCNLSNQQVLKAVDKLSEKNKVHIVNRYLSQRPDRRAKPGRPFEEATLSFQIVCRFAEWRDLQRNRILTPYWRRLNYDLGIDIGEDLEEFGFGNVVQEKLESLTEAHAIIAKDYPAEAQYMVAFGALMPYLITLNFRELVHIAELRTSSGTHKGYAQVASEMARQAKEVYPLLGKTFQFVNW